MNRMHDEDKVEEVSTTYECYNPDCDTKEEHEPVYGKYGLIPLKLMICSDECFEAVNN